MGCQRVEVFQKREAWMLYVEGLYLLLERKKDPFQQGGFELDLQKDFLT